MWWRRGDRPEPAELAQAREDLATAHRAVDEYEPVRLEMDRLAAALRRTLRPPTRPVRGRSNGGTR